MVTAHGTRRQCHGHITSLMSPNCLPDAHQQPHHILNWLDMQAQACPERALRMRHGIDLDSAEYAGRRSSRQALFGDDAAAADEPRCRRC